jgi:pimeloyl-ACP methyl ester carboxylesterase
MTPFEHSAALAARLPGAELVRIEGAGHSVILERAQEVAVAIGGLLDRAARDGAATVPVPRMVAAG